ncbi:MAG: lipase family protein [Yaniella sp.]|nr:lipase family protein [Yaniella sp.]
MWGRRRMRFGAAVLMTLALGMTAGQTEQASPETTEFWDVHETPDSGAKSGEIHSTQQRDDAPDGAQGWNIIYVSEILDDTYEYVSGEVYVPDEPSENPRDVVLWNHQTTGLPDECAPSRTEIDDTRIPELEQLLHDGHIVVGSDYPGQGLPGPVYYMVGQANARASLDALKAAEHLPNVQTSGKFVQYGFSQGGQTTMHAEAMVEDYATDFELLGSALLSPAVRVQDLTAHAMTDAELTGFALSMLSGLKTANPELVYEDFLRQEGIAILPEVDTGCWDIWQVASSAEDPYRDTAMQEDSDWVAAMDDVDDFEPAGSSPFLVHHSVADAIAPVEQARREVDRLCEAGNAVEYHEYDDLEHGSVVVEAAPSFPAWAQARFSGKTAMDHSQN